VVSGTTFSPQPTMVHRGQSKVQGAHIPLIYSESHSAGNFQNARSFVAVMEKARLLHFLDVFPTLHTGSGLVELTPKWVPTKHVRFMGTRYPRYAVQTVPSSRLQGAG
jgi:hypothetical protein